MQGRIQFARVDIIILDRIAIPLHFNLFEAGNGFQKGLLNIIRKRCGNPVRIDRVICKTFRLQEDLVLGPVREPNDLVLDRGTIARAAPRNRSGIHGRLTQIIRDDLVRRFRRPGNRTGDLGDSYRLGQKGERHRCLVGRLLFQRLPVDGRFPQTRRRTGLQPTHPQIEAVKRVRQADRWRFAGPARRNTFPTFVDETAQEGAGRQNHRPGVIDHALRINRASTDIPIKDEILNGGCDNLEIIRRRQLALHG